MAKLIVALDFDTMDEALKMAESLKGHLEWVKVGLELFVSVGPVIIDELKKMGFKVFVDLKLHDIPNTVKGATLALARHKADLLTVHIGGGEDMLRNAAACVKDFENPPLIFGISVLTSMSQKDFSYSSLELLELAKHFAKNANDWGINGVVCSGHEVEEIKKNNPNLLALCPGVRMADNASDDQNRIVTPYEAVKRGADFLVVGRPITKAADPVQATKEILANMHEAEI